MLFISTCPLPYRLHLGMYLALAGTGRVQSGKILGGWYYSFQKLLGKKKNAICGWILKNKNEEKVFEWKLQAVCDPLCLYQGFAAHSLLASHHSFSHSRVL